MTFVDWLVQASIYIPSSVFVGLLALIGVRWTLAGQFRMQRDEWTRLEASHQKEQRERDRVNREEDKKRLIGAVRALAVEAINNAVELLSFVQFAKVNDFLQSSPSIVREHFDRQIAVLTERVPSIDVQQTADVYIRGFRYKRQVENIVQRREQLSEQQIHVASDLQRQFSIVFRTLGQAVFSREEMDAFEKILIIAAQ